MAKRREVTFKSENRKSTFLGRKEKPSKQKIFVLLIVAIFLSVIGLSACYIGLRTVGHAATVKLAGLAIIGLAAAVADIVICIYVWRKYR
jgi:hypothetical protein